MGILDVASGKSVWRGYDYYENKRVLSYNLINENLIDGVVSGSSGERYNVTVDIPHPKRSTCDCPHAEGTRRVCKHKVALYFTAFPDAARKFLEDVRAYEEDEEELTERLEDAVIDHVHNLKKRELEELVLELLFTGPEWQFERFVEENIEV